jgi:hypothetical protein
LSSPWTSRLQLSGTSSIHLCMSEEPSSLGHHSRSILRISLWGWRFKAG